MLVTAAQLRKISKTAKWDKDDEANAGSVVVALRQYGVQVGLDLPHRYTHFIAQLAHESGGFEYDRELRNKDGSLTAAQKRYEDRADLGNTKPGDGEKFIGRTANQITGRGNYARFTKWCRKIAPNCPDFTVTPEKINDDPWEGLATIWYWDEGNPEGVSLNKYADENNIEMITRRINGGTNGLSDRLDYYTRAGLVFLGYGPTDLSAFQTKAKAEGWYDGEVDNEDGPRTRGAIHKALAFQAADKIVASPDVMVTSSPVTETKEVAVAPKGVDNAAPDIGKVAGGLVAGGAAQYIPEAASTFGGLTPVIQGVLIAVAIGFFIWFFYGRQLMAMRASRIKKDVVEAHDAGLPS